MNKQIIKEVSKGRKPRRWKKSQTVSQTYPHLDVFKNDQFLGLRQDEYQPNPYHSSYGYMEKHLTLDLTQEKNLNRGLFLPQKLSEEPFFMGLLDHKNIVPLDDVVKGIYTYAHSIRHKNGKQISYYLGFDMSMKKKIRMSVFTFPDFPGKTKDIGKKYTDINAYWHITNSKRESLRIYFNEDGKWNDARHCLWIPLDRWGKVSRTFIDYANQKIISGSELWKISMKHHAFLITYPKLKGYAFDPFTASAEEIAKENTQLQMQWRKYTVYAQYFDGYSDAQSMISGIKTAIDNYSYPPNLDKMRGK